MLSPNSISVIAPYCQAERYSVKRTLVCAILIVVAVFCFWYAFSRTNGSSDTAGVGKSAGQTSGPQNPQGRTSDVTVAGSSMSAGGVRGAGGSITTATMSPSNSPLASSARNPLLCKSQCQTASSTCQGACYRRYNVTNQTQYWNQCMQICGSRLGICSNDCAAGISLSSTSPTAVSPPEQAPQVPSHSMPTPPLPPQLPDQSSSPSSSSSQPQSLQSPY